MFKLIQKQLNNKKGFTLVELVVVIAILGILGAIVVPKLSSLQDEARIKADAITAAQIISLARVQEINRNDGKAIGTSDSETTSKWDNSYMEYPIPQSGGRFSLSGGLAEKYVVSWIPSKGSIKNMQTMIEGTEFTVDR